MRCRFRQRPSPHWGIFASSGKSSKWIAHAELNQGLFDRFPNTQLECHAAFRDLREPHGFFESEITDATEERASEIARVDLDGDIRPHVRVGTHLEPIDWRASSGPSSARSWNRRSLGSYTRWPLLVLVPVAVQWDLNSPLALNRPRRSSRSRIESRGK